MLRFPSLFFIVWVVIGAIVASQRGYLENLGTIERLLSALLAILLWPLLLLGIDLQIG